MMWVTWRQHRIEALITVIILAMMVLLLLITGREMISAYQNTEAANCLLHGSASLCTSSAQGEFLTRFSGISSLISTILISLPVLVGMFIGAPLVARELEQRTHRLVWTQSITRVRWLGTKVFWLICLTLLTFSVLAALSAWWGGPWVALNSPWASYDIYGILQPVYALFALALGIAVGMLARRSVPAIALTLVLFVLLRLAIALWLRPYFLPPVIALSPISQQSSPPRTAWRISGGLVDRSGQMLPADYTPPECAQVSGNSKDEVGKAFEKCLQDHGLQDRVVYQPLERYWLFQGIEAAIFLLLTSALLALTTWLARKKIF